MFTKYEIKSYPINNSKKEQRKNYFHSKDKSNNYIEDNDNILETNFQPKCIFTKKNNNISFYQSSSKNSFKNSKIKEDNKTPIITPIIKTKNKIYTIKKTIENNNENSIQNFSYNYSDAIGNNKYNIRTLNNNIYQNINNYNKEKTEKINLREHLIKKSKRKKRLTKSCKRQYNLQKRDDFNVLSYKQPENDSDINYKNNNKNKIIQLYKKQGVEEMFFPSKRTHSPSILKKRNKIKEKYLAQTLKNQKFFGSFNNNNSKEGKMVKSSSKTKINQLNDFNIDKLKEIGDKYANLYKPVLPLEKNMNNILHINKIKKNKFQVPINTYNNVFNYSKYSKRTYNPNLDENKENIPVYINEKRVATKKVYKKKIKNPKFIKDKEDNDENNKNDTYKTVKKYLNFKNVKQNCIIDDVIDMEDVNSSTVIGRNKRKKSNNNEFLRKQKSLDYYNKVENDLEKGIPKRKYQKISCDSQMTENNIKPNYIILNKARKNPEKYMIENKEKIMTEKNNYYLNSRNIKEKPKQNNNREILIDINLSRKYKNNQLNKNKSKNYYGYDDRHNLEDTINNHSYFESLYSNKTLKNNSYVKVI